MPPEGHLDHRRYRRVPKYRSTEVPKYRRFRRFRRVPKYRRFRRFRRYRRVLCHHTFGQVGGHFYLDQTSGVPPATFAGRMHSSPVAPRCSTNARGTLCSLRRLGTSTWSSLGTNSDQRLVCDHLTEVVLRSKYLDPPAAVDQIRRGGV
jgi:hypothetical protein